MVSDLNLKKALTDALISAWKGTLGDENDRSLGSKHRARSRQFIAELGHFLDGKYDSDRFHVHWKREGEPVYRRGEVLHDFNVFDIDEEGVSRKCLWQVESEFAYTGRDPLNPKPRKDKLIEDLNKLIWIYAENSLLITSAEWLNDEKEWLLSTLRLAAARWSSFNDTNGLACFYVALIPFVSKWHILGEKELHCKLMNYNCETQDFDTVE